jgi:hypothetical protein
VTVPNKGGTFLTGEKMPAKYDNNLKALLTLGKMDRTNNVDARIDNRHYMSGYNAACFEENNKDKFFIYISKWMFSPSDTPILNATGSFKEAIESHNVLDHADIITLTINLCGEPEINNSRYGLFVFTGSIVRCKNDYRIDGHWSRPNKQEIEEYVTYLRAK